MNSKAIFDAAQAGDLKVCIDEPSSDHLIMSIMGATPRDNSEDSVEIKTQRKQIAQWAIQNGASPMWGMNQTREEVTRKTNSYFTKIKMLKGPGESTGKFTGLKTEI